MSDDDVVLRGLVDIREPGVSNGVVWGELLMAFGVGLAIALVIGAALSFVMRERVAAGRDIDARLAASRDLPQEARLVALARLAREAGVPLPPNARAALYRGDGSVDLDALEAALAAR